MRLAQGCAMLTYALGREYAPERSVGGRRSLDSAAWSGQEVDVQNPFAPTTSFKPKLNLGQGRAEDRVVQDQKVSV